MSSSQTSGWPAPPVMLAQVRRAGQVSWLSLSRKTRMSLIKGLMKKFGLAFLFNVQKIAALGGIKHPAVDNFPLLLFWSEFLTPNSIFDISDRHHTADTALPLKSEKFFTSVELIARILLRNFHTCYLISI